MRDRSRCIMVMTNLRPAPLMTARAAPTPKSIYISQYYYQLLNQCIQQNTTCFVAKKQSAANLSA